MTYTEVVGKDGVWVNVSDNRMFCNVFLKYHWHHVLQYPEGKKIISSLLFLYYYVFFENHNSSLQTPSTTKKKCYLMDFVSILSEQSHVCAGLVKCNHLLDLHT